MLETVVEDDHFPLAPGPSLSADAQGAAAGHDQLAVTPRPRVALVLFGDELTRTMLAGMALIVAGVLLVQVGSERARAATREPAPASAPSGEQATP